MVSGSPDVHFELQMSDTKSRKLVTLSSESARLVDDYRFEQRIGSESEALRRLIDLGLKQVNQGLMPKQETRPE
jgi:hypothetical protein